MSFTDVLNKVLRVGEGRIVKQLSTLAEQVNACEVGYEGIEVSKFKEFTLDFKKRYWGDTWEQYYAYTRGLIAFDADGVEISGPNAEDDITDDDFEPQVLREETPLVPVNGESLENLLPEAFALVREASKQTLGQRHFDVQLMGGAALFRGNIAEMKTGEGKTLVATLPAYLMSLTGLGVHIITVNDYLASYQSELMGRIFRLLGISVGCIISSQRPDVRRKQYNADITYGTNNEFGFDYLRDNMAMNSSELVQRGHNFAIVDEVDSILIDEARTPLIISGHAGGDLNAQYVDFARFSRTLVRDEDYEVDEKKKTVGVLDSGITKLEEHLGIANLYDSVNTPLIQFMQNAIRAKELFARDKDYIVTAGEVKIVDEHTGRVLDGRRYNEGMHQAIEAKEGVKIQAENQTFATITLQNYFRLYNKLSGMTGTAETEAAEFMGTYKLGVIPIPTNKPMQRVDQKDLMFKTSHDKYLAIIEDVRERAEVGQPVLLGTISVEKSEELSKELKSAGIKHNVLNAKHHDYEASIVAMAGRKGAVTVATNMAGRGTDIMLGGNCEFLARNKLHEMGLNPEDAPEEYEQQWTLTLEEMQKQVSQEHDEVVELGGLYVLGTERHESRRIDNQLRGRSGRQGDPGESRFYISLEDDLMRLFGGGRVGQFMAQSFPEGVPIESKLLTNAIANAQSQVEARNFEIRKNVLKYDDVMNRQRDVMYKQRRRVLMGENLAEQVGVFIEEVLTDVIQSETAQGISEDWDFEKIWRELKNYYPISITLDDLIDSYGSIQALSIEVLISEIISDAKIQYAKRVEFVGDEQMRALERQVTLTVLDRLWRNHLYAMDYLKEGIGLRAMAQKDPLVEYTNEGTSLFRQMNLTIHNEIVQFLFNLSIEKQDETGNTITLNSDNQMVITSFTGPAEDSASLEEVENSENAVRPQIVQQAVSNKKLAREANASGNNPYAGTAKNAPCPCGSGKKHKLCHGLE
ncbi:MAG: preprotein translocase subunit SecA [Candidatus Ancillula sp.]|jgi:preprotein translocase subunit SecA|nr:preprotein translocase subunit SecA [Candidatus Ancillula sp.]